MKFIMRSASYEDIFVMRYRTLVLLPLYIIDMGQRLLTVREKCDATLRGRGRGLGKIKVETMFMTMKDLDPTS